MYVSTCIVTGLKLYIAILTGSGTMINLVKHWQGLTTKPILGPFFANTQHSSEPNYQILM